MNLSLFQRLASLGLSVVLTVAMLAGIDGLSQQPLPAQQWAQQSSPQA